MVLKFRFRGQTLVATGELVDTYYGPENRVVIKTRSGEHVATRQEAASLRQIVRWWVEDMRADAEDVPTSFTFKVPDIRIIA